MSVGRIDGSIYGTALLEDVALRDPSGVFLRVPVAEVEKGKAKKADKVEKPEKADKVEKIDKADKIDKAE